MVRLGNLCGIRHLMAVVAVVALLLSLDTLQGGRSCCGYPLQVNLKATPEHTVVAVAADSLFDLEQAKSYLLCPGEVIDSTNPVRWVPGRPFEVRVPCGARTSLLSGRRVHPWQYHALVLRVDYAEGTRQFFAWEIPDRTRSRQLTVTIP